MALSDNEIIKALECCINNKCIECPLNKMACSEAVAMQYALDLINRQKAEIEELVHKLECLLCHVTGSKLSKHTYPLDIMESYANDTIQEYCEEAQAEAIKEFAERLRKKIFPLDTIYNDGNYPINAKAVKATIDNLVKEMVGDNE